jgi:hypothetical protein
MGNPTAGDDAGDSHTRPHSPIAGRRPGPAPAGPGPRWEAAVRIALLVIGPLAILVSLVIGHGLLLAVGLILAVAGLAWRGPCP